MIIKFFNKRSILILLFSIILILAVLFMFKSEMLKVVNQANIKTNIDQLANDNQLISPESGKQKKDAKKDFFIDYKLERDRLRSQEADYLRELINNSNASQQAKDKAQADLLQLSQKVEKEMIVENLIKAKGFEDAVIFLSNDFANIVVKSDALKPKEVAQITDIVTKTTGVPVDKITIIERK